MRTKTPRRISAEWRRNWPETFVVNDGRQDFHSETLLVDTEQVFNDEIHMVMSGHLKVQTEETLDYTMTETMKEHRSLAFTSNNETSEEPSVQFELLQKSAEVTTVPQDVQQGKLFQVTMFYDSNLLLEERNKCLELDQSYGFVKEQQCVLQEDLNELAMYQKLCHVTVTRDKPVEGNVRDDKQTFERKPDFDFEINLVEEYIPSHRNAWNPWTGNGNSGMDAVAQANVIDETQLSNGHRKQLTKRSWKIEHNWNLIQEIAEGTQLNVNGTPQDEPLWLHDLRDNLSVTRMQISSLKVPTATSWSNGSCNGPAAPFKTMWVQYGRFGKLEVSHDLREPLLRENWDVATKNDLPEKKKQNAAQRLRLQLKSLPIGCKESIEHKGKNFSRRNVGNFLYLLVMMMDDSIIAPERQIESLSMEQLENELSLTYLIRGQSTLMRKYVAEQILGNCLETFSTYLEIYSLDVEVIMEVGEMELG